MTRTRRYLTGLALGDPVAVRATMLILAFLAVVAAAYAGVMLK